MATTDLAVVGAGPAGLDLTVSLPVMQAIAARAVRFLPELAQVGVIRSYAGLRPCSPDHLPLVGPVSASPGVYLATGHEGAGICLRRSQAAWWPIASSASSCPPLQRTCGLTGSSLARPGPGDCPHLASGS